MRGVTFGIILVTYLKHTKKQTTCYVFGSVKSIKYLTLLHTNQTILPFKSIYSFMLGGVRDVAIFIFLMKRLKKTESANF